MKEETPEKIVKSYCQHIREEIAQGKDINQNGCNDPFWSDGCNMNLTRNHIIYYQSLIAEICAGNQLQLPVEYYLSVPPEVDNYYMANLKQKNRVNRIFFQRKLPERKRYIYDEQQMSLFSQLNLEFRKVLSMENAELTALQTVRDEYRKIKDKYQKKAAKEREKVNDVYVLVCGEKCYTDSEVNDWYASDYITCEQSDKYIEKLNKKKATAGQTDTLTKSERVCKILDNTIDNLTLEIRDIKIKEEQEQKKQERWEIAQAQGLSYKEFLELEEVSRQSEEYEKLMVI